MIELSIYSFLFVDNGKFYLYNSHTNFFSEISIDLYNALNVLDLKSIPEDIIQELTEREVLVAEENKYDYFYSELLKFNQRNNNREILNLVIAPTTACNFACPYCFESKEDPQTMSDETITDIAKFVEGFYGSKEISITWYGGEPLIAFETIKKIHSALSKKGLPKIAAQHVVTNGYCFSDDIIDFFKINGCNSIQITIDGLNDMHDKTRRLKNSSRPTFDRIITNIEHIVAELTDTTLQIRVNINKQNYAELVRVFNFFKSKYPNKKNIQIYPGIIREETADKRSLCDASFRSSEMLDLHELIRKEGIDISDFPRKIYKGCMMQQIASFVIGPEGNLYKCWNDITDKTKAIGNVKRNELTNSHTYIKYMTQSIPFSEECKDCHVFPICDGGCSHHRYRNMFENGCFDLCSPYRDKEQLKKALLSKKI